jgi:hypothetical protein
MRKIKGVSTNMMAIGWNIYATKPENQRKVIQVNYPIYSITDTLNKMENDANNWNKNEMRENMKIHIITCEGYIRNV